MLEFQRDNFEFYQCNLDTIICEQSGNLQTNSRVGSWTHFSGPLVKRHRSLGLGTLADCPAFNYLLNINILFWGWAPFFWLAQWSLPCFTFLHFGSWCYTVVDCLVCHFYLLVLGLRRWLWQFRHLQQLLPNCVIVFVHLLANGALVYNTLWSYIQYSIQRNSFDPDRTRTDRTEIQDISHSTGCKSGPKSRRGSTCKSLGGWFLFVGTLAIHLQANHRGEGCSLPMETAGVSSNSTDTALHFVDTKPHGEWPSVCPGTLPWQRPGTKVLKRSLTRAYKRALTCGFAWYKGRCLTIKDFQHMDFAPAKLPSSDPTLTARPLEVYRSYNLQQAPKGRVTCVSWNCGGLSQHKLDEVRLWTSVQNIQITLLMETHWGYSNTWSDNWHTIHSGVEGQRRAGLAVMVAKSLCTSAQLKWHEVIPGYLLHIRIQLPGRPLDLVCCYQHTCLRTKPSMQLREQWWSQFDSLLRNLPRRNLLIVAGDFNCSLPFLKTLTGTDGFKWQSQTVKGPQHPDMGRFAEIVKTHGLTALNTWDATLGPSYINQDSGSRIDFAMTRLTSTDGEAKRVSYLRNAPFLHDGRWGHFPMLFSVKRHWTHGTTPHHQKGISLRQRLVARQALTAGNENWMAFIHTASFLMTQNCEPVTTSGTLDVERMHQLIQPLFHQCFAAKPTPPVTHPWQQATSLIMNKWEHRHKMLAIHDLTQIGVFQAWFHWSRFNALSRRHRRHARVLRAMKFQDLVTEASVAASRHDMFELYRTINRYTPKQQHRRIHLRNSAGNIATPEESRALLVDFVSDTWKGPSTFALPGNSPPGVPFTVRDLASELSRIPISKAVAAPFIPGMVWKELADTLAPMLHEQLLIWWNSYPPYIPQSWKDGWLCLLAKPLKPPTQPGNLRPIALQEPIGKAVIGLLTKIAMHQALPQIQCWPLMAYLPGRSGLDCLLRVSQHCKAVRDLVQLQRGGPHQRAQSIPRHSVCGGAQIFLDLSRAFDMVSRTRLFHRLGQLGISPSIVCLLGHWHQNTYYHVAHDSGSTPVLIGKGVRQGCKGAPFLFNCFVVLLMRDLSTQLPAEWIKACITVYADDFHVGCIFRSVQELEYMSRAFRILFQTLTSFDMLVNPSKSVALLALTGTAARKQRQRFVQRTQSGHALRLHADGLDDIFIPLQTNAKYLGAVMTYTSVEDETLKHRLALARINFNRLQPWLSKRHSLTIKQRVAIWQTCILPIVFYGTLATDISFTGLQLMQKSITNMLRKIARDHAFYSGHTHVQFFQAFGLSTPVQLLHGAIDSLLQSVTQRLILASGSDIVQDLTWNHLISLKLRVDSLEAQDLLAGTLPSTLQATGTPITCAICAFQTNDVSNFRRHCTQVHHMGTYRTNNVEAQQFMLNGLPTCRFCLTRFASWRNFTVHVERGCQALIAGPLAAGLVSRWPPTQPVVLSGDNMPSAADILRGTRVITSAELAYLKQQQWGEELLALLDDRAPERISQNQTACHHLARHCILCGQFVSRTQEMLAHLRQNHADLAPLISERCIQLTNLHCTDCPCAYCGAAYKNHTCPVWLQLTVLILHGAGIHAAHAETMQQQLRCQICLELLSTAAELTQHLQSVHGLAGLTFNSARDCMTGTETSPACTHCGSVHSSLEGLRSHIVKGRCRFFNPDACGVNGAPRGVFGWKDG